MKKYIAVLLMLVSTHALLADVSTSPGSIQLAPSAGDIAPSVRVMTQDEFDGKVPIVIHVNESLVAPIHYQLLFVTNTPQLFFGPQGLSEVSIAVDGFTPSDDSGAVEFNLICTGTQVGQATVRFGEVGQMDKEFNIQIIE